ncbi:hypothetical protein CLOM_g19279 [Closterium sp. NIES-68]|nr:hypothetical protein CLOM_g19279 [Closterium sp. NIES-68]GJP80431.1 hypothetical protein CLOP_g10634 [Closterium sp. NIES-67]
MRTVNKYANDLIINADQTPLFLEMPQETTLEVCGSRTVHIRTAGYEKERLTVMLAVTAGGQKLKSYVIFKCKTLPKIRVPPGIVIRAQEKGWIDEDHVKDCIMTVLVPFLKRLPTSRGGRQKALVVLDSYKGHLTEGVAALMRLFKLSRAVIPGGCTPIVQPLDVAVNRCLKAHVRRSYSGWFEEFGCDSTIPAGNLKKPSAEVVLQCIAAAWKAVPANLIRKAFKTCGISNDLDCLEDDLILAHVHDKAEMEVMDDVHAEVETTGEKTNPFFEAEFVEPTADELSKDKKCDVAVDVDLPQHAPTTPGAADVAESSAMAEARLNAAAAAASASTTPAAAATAAEAADTTESSDVDSAEMTPAAEVLAGLAASRSNEEYDWDDIASDDDDVEAWHVGDEDDDEY